MADLINKETLKLQIQKYQTEIKLYDKMIQYNQTKMDELMEDESKKIDTKKRKSTSETNLPSKKPKLQVLRVNEPEKQITDKLTFHEEEEEAVEEEEEQEEEANGPDMTGWSEIKKRAWRNKTRNVNNFLHYFKPDGEEAKTGKWTVEENNFFIDKINEKGKVKLWGEFSREIPGRTGSQCLANYHALLKKQKGSQK
jgi:hypothetical protein